MRREKEKALEIMEQASPLLEEEEELLDINVKLVSTNTELNELELPSIGKEYDAIVKRIKLGTLGQFIEIDRIKDEEVRNRLKERENDFAILIEFEVPELVAIGYDVVRYSLHPNSKLIKLARRYGKIRVGDRIKVVLNEKGRFKISA